MNFCLILFLSESAALSFDLAEKKIKIKNPPDFQFWRAFKKNGLQVIRILNILGYQF